jgi:hypothetical protein
MELHRDRPLVVKNVFAEIEAQSQGTHVGVYA